MSFLCSSRINYMIGNLIGRGVGIVVIVYVLMYIFNILSKPSYQESRRYARRR